jgi:hypothetical protein
MITNKDLSAWTFKTALCCPCSLFNVYGERGRRIEEEKQPPVTVPARVMEETLMKKKMSSNGGEISHQPTAKVLKETASQLLKTNGCGKRKSSDDKKPTAAGIKKAKLLTATELKAAKNPKRLFKPDPKSLIKPEIWETTMLMLRIIVNLWGQFDNFRSENRVIYFI